MRDLTSDPAFGDSSRILVAPDHFLVRKPFYRNKVWSPARIVHQDIGSYSKWLDALTLLYDYDGRLFLPDGAVFRHPEITDVFTDQSNRWMGDFLEADETGEAPKSYCRKLERLRLIELYCRLIEHAEWP